MSTNNGGPAFPGLNAEFTGISSDGEERFDVQPSGGMTLRDYFAAKAMQTLIACVWERHGDTNHIIDDDGRTSLHLRAYEHADSMLEVRTK